MIFHANRQLEGKKLILLFLNEPSSPPDRFAERATYFHGQLSLLLVVVAAYESTPRSRHFSP